jgi:hypothetical protein
MGGRIFLRYTITTYVVRKDPNRGTAQRGLYEVVDVIAYESGKRKTFVRFTGTRDECQKKARQVRAYWNKVLSAKPPV